MKKIVLYFDSCPDALEFCKEFENKPSQMLFKTKDAYGMGKTSFDQLTDSELQEIVIKYGDFQRSKGYAKGAYDMVKLNSN